VEGTHLLKVPALFFLRRCESAESFDGYAEFLTAKARQMFVSEDRHSA